MGWSWNWLLSIVRAAGDPGRLWHLVVTPDLSSAWVNIFSFPWERRTSPWLMWPYLCFPASWRPCVLGPKSKLRLFLICQNQVSGYTLVHEWNFIHASHFPTPTPVPFLPFLLLLLVITNAEKLLCDRHCGEPFTHTDLFDSHDILSYFIDKETEVQRGEIMCLRFYITRHDEDINLPSLTLEPIVNGCCCCC